MSMVVEIVLYVLVIFSLCEAVKWLLRGSEEIELGKKIAGDGSHGDTPDRGRSASTEKKI